MTDLTPIQLFLWIIFLEVASVPIIAFLYTWISNIQMSRHRELIGTILQATSEVIKKRNESKNNEQSS